MTPARVEHVMTLVGAAIRAELRRIARRKAPRESFDAMLARLDQLFPAATDLRAAPPEARPDIPLAGRASFSPPEFLSPVKQTPEFHKRRPDEHRPEGAAIPNPSWPGSRAVKGRGPSTPSTSSGDVTGLAAIGRRHHVAGVLGVSLDWFDRHRKALVADHAFPAPLRPTGQPRWQLADVILWAASSNPPLLRRAQAAHRRTSRKVN